MVCILTPGSCRCGKQGVAERACHAVNAPRPVVNIRDAQRMARLLAMLSGCPDADDTGWWRDDPSGCRRDAGAALERTDVLLTDFSRLDPDDD